MNSLWQRPTFFTQTCAVCRGAAALEYAVTPSGEPSSQADWTALCYKHYQSSAELKATLLGGRPTSSLQPASSHISADTIWAASSVVEQIQQVQTEYQQYGKRIVQQFCHSSFLVSIWYGEHIAESPYWWNIRCPLTGQHIPCKHSISGYASAEAAIAEAINIIDQEFQSCESDVPLPHNDRAVLP